MKYAIFILVFACFALFFVVTENTNAQINPLLQPNVNVNMTPEYPGPNENAKVTLTSYSTNIDAARITWILNGQNKKSGTGERSFSFSVGDMNTTTTLEILVVTIEGESVSKTIRIKPVSIDMLWQTESYVPPFYKGKSMFSHQNRITFIAIPHIMGNGGQEINPKNLLYRWTNSGKVIESASGYGKNAYSFVSSIISHTQDIGVNVTTIDGAVTGKTQLSVRPAEPEIIFYKKNPLYGVEFQKAITTTSELKGENEVAITAIPFFFGLLSPMSSDINYKWSINGSLVDNDFSQASRVFRRVENTSGTAKISLEIENTNKILQVVEKSFNLEFGENDNQ